MYKIASSTWKFHCKNANTSNGEHLPSSAVFTISFPFGTRCLISLRIQVSWSYNRMRSVKLWKLKLKMKINYGN